MAAIKLILTYIIIIFLIYYVCRWLFGRTKSVKRAKAAKKTNAKKQAKANKKQAKAAKKTNAKQARPLKKGVK